MMEKENDQVLQQNQPSKSRIKLKYRQYQIIMHPSLQTFCQLLTFDDLIASHHISTDPQDQVIELQIPSCVEIQHKHFQILGSFMEIHHFSPVNVKIGKINFLNQYEYIGKETFNFIVHTLDPMPTEDIRSFLQTMKYLGASSVEKVLYTYLCKRLALPLQLGGVIQTLGQKGIKQYERQQMQGLKEEMIPFFQSYGLFLLENYEESMKKK